VVHAYGAHNWMKSEIGKGNTFSFSLLAARVERAWPSHYCKDATGLTACALLRRAQRSQTAAFLPLEAIPVSHRPTANL